MTNEITTTPSTRSILDRSIAEMESTETVLDSDSKMEDNAPMVNEVNADVALEASTPVVEDAPAVETATVADTAIDAAVGALASTTENKAVEVPMNPVAEAVVSKASGKQKSTKKPAKKVNKVQPGNPFSIAELAKSLGCDKQDAYGLVKFLGTQKLIEKHSTRKTTAGKGKPENLYVLSKDAPSSLAGKLGKFIL